MIKVRQVIVFVAGMGAMFSAYGISELELQKLDRLSLPPLFSTNTLEKVFIDLNVVSPPQIKNANAISMREYRAQLKQRFALQINSKWQVGLDSFKACPIDKPPIDWPKSTAPKEGRTPSQKGYGLGVRMKLD